MDITKDFVLEVRARCGVAGPGGVWRGGAGRGGAVVRWGKVRRGVAWSGLVR